MQGHSQRKYNDTRAHYILLKILYLNVTVFATILYSGIGTVYFLLSIVFSIFYLYYSNKKNSLRFVEKIQRYSL